MQMAVQQEAEEHAQGGAAAEAVQAPPQQTPLEASTSGSWRCHLESHLCLDFRLVGSRHLDSCWAVGACCAGQYNIDCSQMLMWNAIRLLEMREFASLLKMCAKLHAAQSA